MPAPGPTILPHVLGDNSGVSDRPPAEAEIRAEIRNCVDGLLDLACSDDPRSLADFERELHKGIFVLARLLLVLFACVWEARIAASLPSRVQGPNGRVFRRRPPQARSYHSFFGVIRYWRTYLRAIDGKGAAGYHPLDLHLGLTADRVSMTMTSVVGRLASMMSFAQAQIITRWTLGSAPSTEVIEKSVLGLGAYTEDYFEQAPPPEGDGDILVIQLDAKGAPTAREQELERRRGKRRPHKQPRHCRCKRHRGRHKRCRHGSKARRKKGDKSKNAKMANIVVLYTLERGTGGLHGPVNKKVYGSFASKRHAFEVARREATKRGFPPGTDRIVQVATDGDDDLAKLAREYFPEAIHTPDIIHVIERLWTAGECLHPEGSDELQDWVERQKTRLYDGKVRYILRELRQQQKSLPRSGPGSRGKRQRLANVIRYIAKRQSRMNYDYLQAMDLELATGVVEGAVKHVVGYRMDHGGMRWIKERAQAVLQLRCIEINGDWDEFIAWVHGQIQAKAQGGEVIRLQRNSPEPLRQLQEAA